MSKKNIILFTVFVDILGIGVVIPVLPFYVQSFAHNEFVVSLLFAVFSFFAFLSSPLLGSISDKVGRRPVLLLSIASSAIGWFIFAFAPNLFWLFVGRIIDGASAGNISTAQSYLADIATNDKERTANLGLIGAMFGIGLTVGPLIGGVLGKWGHSIPFFFTAILATVNFFLAWKNLPETHRPNTVARLNFNPLTPIINSLKDKLILPSLIAWVLFGSAISVLQTIFTLYASRVFSFDEFESGLVLMGMGIILIINQGYFLRKFWIARYKERNLEIFMLLALGVTFLIMLVSNVYIFIIAILFSVVCQSVLRVVMTSQIVALEPQKRGEVLGILNSFMSISMIIGPLLSGFLFTKYTFGPFLLAGGFALLAFAIMYKRLRNLELQLNSRQIEVGAQSL